MRLASLLLSSSSSSSRSKLVCLIRRSTWSVVSPSDRRGMPTCRRDPTQDKYGMGWWWHNHRVRVTMTIIVRLFYREWEWKSKSQSRRRPAFQLSFERSPFFLKSILGWDRFRAGKRKRSTWNLFEKRVEMLTSRAKVQYQRKGCLNKISYLPFCEIFYLSPSMEAVSQSESTFDRRLEEKKRFEHSSLQTMWVA